MRTRLNRIVLTAVGQCVNVHHTITVTSITCTLRIHTVSVDLVSDYNILICYDYSKIICCDFVGGDAGTKYYYNIQ